MILKKIGYGLGIAKNYRVGSGIGYPSGPAPLIMFDIIVNSKLINWGSNMMSAKSSATKQCVPQGRVKQN